MIERIGKSLSAFAQKYIPDPFIFAILLTAAAYVSALIFTDSGPGQVVEAWGKGFWELLAFGMQMCLVLVTGHALANSRPIRKAIVVVAGIPKTGAGAAATVTLVACISGLVNWGLALVVGALLAREMAFRGEEKGRRFHYPLLAAGGYAGLLVWHGGLSGSIPLLVATNGHFLEAKIGVVAVEQTLYSPMNIVLTLVLLAVIPLVMALVHPKTDVKTISDFHLRTEESECEVCAETLAQKFEYSRLVSILPGLFGLIFLVRQTVETGFHPDLNMVNLSFLSLGLICHDNLHTYLRAVTEGAKACAGIILQFPFYAGIMGIMKYTGLMKIMSMAVAGHVGPTLLPVVTFLSAGVVNLFVPSGGGQWAVQGPVAVEATKLLGASMPKTIMAVAYGDEWTNMFQPFWALALLGITKLRASDIMGYTLLMMFVAMPIFVLALLLLPA